MFRSINSDNRNMSVSDKLDMAISRLCFDDFIGAINYVQNFVNMNY